MTLELLPPDREATPQDLQRARERQDLLRTELPRVREAALAWRNGMGALLVGLVGFGLIKGRSDVSTLASPWPTVVGIILLLALAVGAFAAWSFLTAAHGLPTVTPVANLVSQADADHEEALRAAKRLRWGIRATCGCMALLVVGVAFTWYGPAAAPSGIRVTTPLGVVCGSVLQVGPLTDTLTTSSGKINFPRDDVQSVIAGGPC